VRQKSISTTRPSNLAMVGGDQTRPKSPNLGRTATATPAHRAPDR
jgi:hypothetical protein